MIVAERDGDAPELLYVVLCKHKEFIPASIEPHVTEKIKLFSEVEP